MARTTITLAVNLSEMRILRSALDSHHDNLKDVLDQMHAKDGTATRAELVLVERLQSELS